MVVLLAVKRAATVLLAVEYSGGNLMIKLSAMAPISQVRPYRSKMYIPRSLLGVPLS